MLKFRGLSHFISDQNSDSRKNEFSKADCSLRHWTWKLLQLNVRPCIELWNGCCRVARKRRAEAQNSRHSSSTAQWRTITTEAVSWLTGWTSLHIFQATVCDTQTLIFQPTRLHCCKRCWAVIEPILKEACSQGYPRAQFAFKDLMIHWILQFALRIAFRCVLHRCENLDIHC